MSARAASERPPRSPGARERPVVPEIVVVEGLHDRQAVERAVTADVWVLGGDRIARKTLSELRRAAHRRGVIVFTDPDGAGERIRRRVDEAVPGCRHAFLPRSAAVSARGIGVEHAAPEDIARALLHARGKTDGAAPRPPARGDEAPAAPTGGDAMTQTDAPAAAFGGTFSMADLEQAGLVGEANAAARRQAVGDYLGIGTGNAKAFVRKLNALSVTRTEWEEAVKQVCPLSRKPTD
ncbi:DUF4093 domain-containing protein [Alicyclobacillus cycloheptanicus]|nr:DUF4093 domain-containing protein [Alicyclobacillus cycloheptanicus]